jgi:hypothetical protein
VEWGARQDVWRDLDPLGWLGYPRPAVTPEEHRRGVDWARGTYAGSLAQFRITETPDRALRELLGLCRQEQIGVTFLLMPEGSEFRSWYPPAARATIDAYLADLSRAYGAPIVDCRDWMQDAAFVDSHHLLPGGATAFSRRLGEELVRRQGSGVRRHGSAN